jgi:hypothetical protein
VLFSIIALLTWFSKNGILLSGGTSKKITLCSNQGDFLIVYKDTNHKSNHHTVISPGSWTVCHPRLRQISEWDFISSGSPVDITCVTPPETWFVTDLQKAATLPSWPQPSQLSSVHYSHKTQISLKSISTDQTFMQCMIDSISFLILSDSTMMNEKVLYPYFESIDILIIRTDSPELAAACRSYTRPRLCITTAYLPVTGTTPANMMYLGDSCTSVELTISDQKKIVPIIKSCVQP